MFKKFLSSVVAIGALVLAGQASAATISIGATTTNTAPLAFTSGSSAAVGGVQYFNTVGGISFAAFGTGVGNPTVISPLLLNGFSIDSSSLAGGDAYLWITETGLSAPLGNQSFITAFTDLLLPLGWTASVTSYFDQTNTAFGTATALTPAALTFAGPCPICASQTAATTVLGVSAPYSITEVLHIVATGQGSSTQNVAISAVPGPIVGAGLPGLIAACGGLLALARRRRKEAV